MTQPLGFSYDLAVSRWPALAGRVAVIGGTAATCGQAAAALALLEAARGAAIRQVLAAARSPLAGCDYHAAAAPFREAFSSGGPDPGRPVTGRGAAGYPAERLAFIRAIRAALGAAARLEPARHYAAELGTARDAFSADEEYAAAMARSAASLLAAGHSARLREQLAAGVRSAVSACASRAGEFTCAAVSACGTGDCRLAGPALAGLPVTVPAGPGRVPRPANHDDSGSGFGVSAALAALEASAPFSVRAAASLAVEGAAASTVRVSGADHARARDAVPGSSVPA